MQDPMSLVYIVGVGYIVVNGFAYMIGGPRQVGRLNRALLRMIRGLIGGTIVHVGKGIAGNQKQRRRGR